MAAIYASCANFSRVTYFQFLGKHWLQAVDVLLVDTTIGSAGGGSAHT
jgi:hypothetical protein